MRNIATILFFGLLLAGAVPALPNQYWVSWDGDDFPENQGWTRSWGNWQGEHQGSGANRTLENGILTYDSLYDPGIYDLAHMDRPIDPTQGELFVMEWRLKVDQVVGWSDDPAVYAISDGAAGVAFGFGESSLVSVWEHVSIPVNPSTFHAYRLSSWDMLNYELSMDGALVRRGVFMPLVNQSHVGWGDDVQGAASLHHWDYFRFGVVPEPGAVQLVSAVLACCVGRRR